MSPAMGDSPNDSARGRASRKGRKTLISGGGGGGGSEVQ